MKRKLTTPKKRMVTAPVSLADNVIAFPVVAKKPAVTSDSASLPFVKSLGRGKGCDYWSVETTGNYSDDCELGRQYAEQFLDLPRTYGNATLLGAIAWQMVQKGPVAKGIAIGFMATINKAAFAARQLLEERGFGA